MKRNPTRAARGVQQRVENGPISDRIRTIFHPFGLAKRRGYRSRVEMIAPDRDRRFQIAALDEIVDRFAHFGAFAVAEPADARGQALEVHAIAREPQPAIQRAIVGKHLEREIVGLANVLRIAGERDPAKGSLAFTKQWANVLRHKAGNVERVLATGVERLLADVVAVVES